MKVRGRFFLVSDHLLNTFKEYFAYVLPTSFDVSKT